MPVVTITDEFVANQLTCPEGKKSIEYCCDTVRGMYILVTAKSPGVGTFFLRFKDSTGKTTHLKVGRTTEISRTDAQKTTRRLKAEIQLGANPRAEIKAKKAVPTFADFFTAQYLPFIQGRNRTAKNVEDMFNNRLKAEFGSLRLNQFRTAQVQKFHTGLRAEGLAPATANHHIKALRHCLNMAVKWGVIENNPIAQVSLFREDNKKEFYLEGDNLNRLMHVLHNDDNRMVCNLALLLLATGARLNEALQAEWKHIDRDKQVWRIPIANSKSKKARSVPLNAAALTVLSALDTEDKYEHLFTNRKTGKRLKYVHKVWHRLRAEAGLPELRLHDLRHSFASFLVGQGRSLYMVQQILGHSDPVVTQRYAHLSMDDLIAASDDASKLMNDATATTGG